MKRICFLVGSVEVSGGTYVIFQHASYLRKQGYDVTLAVQSSFNEATLAWHDEGQRLRCIPIVDAYKEQFDLVIATWWKTALELAQFKTDHHAYFVQSIESRFYAEDERPLRALVDQTYQLPISYVTEASWIVSHLKEHFGHHAALVRNGIRKDIYTLDGAKVAPRPKIRPRVLVEGHFNVAFKNTALAIRLAYKAGARDIWVLTGSSIHSLPKASRIFSCVPIRKVAEVYRSCDILLKLSTVEGMFGPPLEMFHCGGTALVFDVSGHDEYIQCGKNAIVVRGRDTKGVVSELRKLLANRDRLADLQQGAIETARSWPDWSQSSSEFSDWVATTLEAPETDQQTIASIIRQAWDVYKTNEGERLRQMPSIAWRNRVIGLANKLPKRLQNKIKQARAFVEVLMPSSKVADV